MTKLDLVGLRPMARQIARGRWMRWRGLLGVRWPVAGDALYGFGCGLPRTGRPGRLRYRGYKRPAPRKRTSGKGQQRSLPCLGSRDRRDRFIAVQSHHISLVSPFPDPRPRI
jgi:hypothetical protein